jgi:lysophospholipase-3
MIVIALVNYAMFAIYSDNVIAHSQRTIAIAGGVAAVPRSIPGNRAPLVIIPGAVGSILEAKLDKPASASWLCSLKSDWYTLWISEIAMLAQTCFFENIKLRYLGGGRTAPAEGVEMRVPFYGDSVAGVRCMLPQSPAKCDSTRNWKVIIDRLERLGYQVGVDLFSAPYDFRQGPQDFMADAFPKLKKLIEQTFSQNGRKVKLVTNSMGGTYIHLFLTQFVDQEWKDHYIHSWFSLAGVFNGFAQSFENVVFGRNQILGFPVFAQTDVRDAYRSWPSATWLIPKPIYGDNRVILETPTRQYRLSDIPDLLHGEQKEMYLLSFQYNVTADPGVPVHCCFAVQHETPIGYKTKIEFDRDTFYSSEGIQVEEVYGPGDNTGDEASLSLCMNWKSTVRHIELRRCHGCILDEPKVANYIEQNQEKLSTTAGSKVTHQVGFRPKHNHRRGH